ncbi:MULTISPECIES: hypothetical protein [Brevibacillus]|uniref:hypothetical protein n=1 Tax=Brevibacillus TaxID=55080 RepID=UPI000D1109AB|nr:MULTISPECIES: hypothetical protein [Brevibacillus]MED1948036.1 hypothetical protein [Brevibacillus formosus]MED1998233.1 hypothetical protein [Brevibacillus formosus]MED2080774.1 hypothetical protein [Brevibacillus formosus]PSK20557.1 hypothetical protein C7R94_03970 [Brevibacillus sp. NRRL NRS-603]
MDTNIEKALCTTLEYWDRMKKSHEDDAEDDANQFEASFYRMMELIREWYDQLETKPDTLEDALLLPDVAEVAEQLPVEIMLNFETELELIVDGQIREDDEKYD